MRARSTSHRNCEGGVNRLPDVRKLTVLRCCVNGDLMEGRGDNVRGLNLRGSLDESRQGLQHLGVRIGVVSFCTGFVVPQTDGRYIFFAGTAERNFVLKAVLLAK